MDNKPIWSKSIGAGGRVYHVDVRLDSRQQHYVTLTEIPKDDKKARKRVFIHHEHLGSLIDSLLEANEFINR